MTDETAMADACSAYLSTDDPPLAADDVFEAGFAAGLAHARKWRALTSDPASWPEVGQEVAILWRDRRTSTGTLRAIRGANAFDRLITHWLPLPPPPKGESK